MGVSSSLYSSISGLSSMGEAMSILGDNVANVNTISFKSSRSSFQDVLAQSVSTASGSAQVGRGVTMSTVSSIFAQGSFESSASSLDMAIGGQGFFMIRNPDSAEADMYTRAGQFDFDQQGYIVNPMGNFAQGWTIDSLTGETAGTIGDMRIEQTTPPVSTKEVELIANLDSRKDNEVNQTRLFDAWNGTNPASIIPTDPIDSTQFDYTTAIKIFDSKGASHDLTVYFDRTTNDNEWEFLVTSDPSEDKRVLDSREQIIYVPDTTYNYENHKGAGALMYGTLQFDTSGNIKGMEAFDVPPDGKVDPSMDDNRIILGSTDSYYSFDANFTGATTNDSIRLNLGAKYSGASSQVKQTLVSELGALDKSSTGTDYITSETLWKNVSDQNSMTLSGDGAVGTSDTITIKGFDHAGVRKSLVYQINNDTKVQDLLDKIDAEFGITSSIDAAGRLKMTDNLGGVSGLSIGSFVVDGSIDGSTINDPANPFGKTGTNGATVVNVTTAKQKLISQGQLLTSSGNASTSSAAPWSAVYDDAPAAVAAGDVFTITGFTGDGTAVSTTLTVPTPATDGTVQDLLDLIESKFNADAEIDGAGRLVVTDRVADSAIIGGYASQLAITSLVSSGTANPFDDANSTNEVAAGNPNTLITTDTTFHTISADTSGEDNSLQGVVVSSSFSPEALSTTQYANSSSTIFQDQNGFASGFMQSVSVDTSGIITGHYSNGQVLKKAQIAMANFSNMSGLFKEGGNVFKETTDSGAPVTGTAGSNGLGSISPNSLEQSNVDLGAEFVKLITVQRGFQANSKIITTTDEMMNDLINMKR